MGERFATRSRWAAIGAAVAVTLGAGGLYVVNAANSAPSSVVTVDPVRILDTRDPVDLGLNGPFASPTGQKLQVTGSIPTSAGQQTVVPPGATGVLLNVTGFNPSADGFISIRPGNATGAPQTSSLNVLAGSTTPNAVTVALPTTGSNTGQIDIVYDALGQVGPTTEMFIDVVGYLQPAGTGGIVAASNKKDNVDDPAINTFGTAMSVTLTVESVGIIQITGSVLVVTPTNADGVDCDLMRTTGSNDDLDDTDRRVWIDANREGFCSTNGTIAVGPGTHQIDLRVRRSQTTTSFDDGTLQAIFIPGGVLDNTDG